MSLPGEGFESYFAPKPSPELAAYLKAHEGIDPATVLLLNHIPPLIAGPKSSKFVIREQDASLDTPPESGTRVDLSRMAVSSNNMAAFANFFDEAEAQADAQYEAALFETQQLLAEADTRSVAVSTLFVPDTANSTASGYFRRLTRLAQDTGIEVVLRVVDYDDGKVYEGFQRFEPIRAASAVDYWNKRATERDSHSRALVRLRDYSVYTMEGAYTIEGPSASEALAAITLPTVRPPFIFTTFEQLQKDYPNSPISDPAIWEVNKQNYTLVSDETAYAAVSRECEKERTSLRHAMRHAAYAHTAELRQLLLGENSSHKHRLSTIRELAASSGDNQAQARIILAKLGDSQNAATILNEIQNATGGYGSEPLTIVPLGIHLRHDEELFDAVIEDVKEAINNGLGNVPQLLSLLGALYHSHDPRVGELMASYLTVPAGNDKAYASTVLHAAIRWMPEYTLALYALPHSDQRGRSLNAIETQTAVLLDACNRGKLDAISSIYGL